ncbi:MAG: helix-turn-helix domain-containing protein [Candidatus Baltobacteraceae bacterium]
MSLGERFRAAREQRGLTLSEVAEHLRIRSVYLAAIEEENWAAIGAAVYARGFLRTYARYLALDPEEAVGEYNAASGSAASPSAVAAGQSAGQPARLGGDQPRGLTWLLWAAGAIALALVGFVVYLYVSPAAGPPASRAGQTIAVSPAPADMSSPAPAHSAAAAAPASEPHTLAIVLEQASWLRVSVDGSVRMEGTLPAGTRKTFHGTSALVRVGNAGGVQITVDGRPLGKLGAPGDVVEKTFAL